MTKLVSPSSLCLSMPTASSRLLFPYCIRNICSVPVGSFLPKLDTLKGGILILKGESCFVERSETKHSPERINISPERVSSCGKNDFTGTDTFSCWLTFDSNAQKNSTGSRAFWPRLSRRKSLSS